MLGDCVELAGRALSCSRDLTNRLRPPVLDEVGIAPALNWLAQATSQWYGLDVTIDSDADDVPLDDDLQALLFDAVRDLLLNVAKHSGVSSAHVEVRAIRDRLGVAVIDEGVGMGQAERTERGQDGYGLASIRERIEAMGGTMRVETAPGAGARVTLDVPGADGAPPRAP